MAPSGLLRVASCMPCAWYLVCIAWGGVARWRDDAYGEDYFCFSVSKHVTEYVFLAVCVNADFFSPRARCILLNGCLTLNLLEMIGILAKIGMRALCAFGLVLEWAHYALHPWGQWGRDAFVSIHLSLVWICFYMVWITVCAGWMGHRREDGFDARLALWMASTFLIPCCASPRLECWGSLRVQVLALFFLTGDACFWHLDLRLPGVH